MHTIASLVHLLCRMFWSYDDQHWMSRYGTWLLQSAVDESRHGGCLCPATDSAVASPGSSTSSAGASRHNPAVQRLLCAGRSAGALDRLAGGARAATATLRRVVRRSAAARHRQRRDSIGRCLSAARRRRRHSRRPHQGVPVRSGGCCGCCSGSGERCAVAGIALLRPVTATSLGRQRRRCGMLAAVHLPRRRRVVVKNEASGSVS